MSSLEVFCASLEAGEAFWQARGSRELEKLPAKLQGIRLRDERGYSGAAFAECSGRSTVLLPRQTQPGPFQALRVEPFRLGNFHSVLCKGLLYGEVSARR